MEHTNGNGTTHQRDADVSGNALDAYKSQGTSPPDYEKLQAEERLQRVLELLAEGDLERLSELLGDGRKLGGNSDSPDEGMYNTNNLPNGGNQT